MDTAGFAWEGWTIFYDALKFKPRGFVTEHPVLVLPNSGNSSLQTLDQSNLPALLYAILDVPTFWVLRSRNQALMM
jgi:hypothetical protein